MTTTLQILETLTSNVNYAVVFGLLLKAEMTFEQLKEMTTFSNKELEGILDWLDKVAIIENVYEKGLTNHFYRASARGMGIATIFSKMSGGD